MSDYEDPAWEEYLSTGEDPTGGDLDDDETLYEVSRQTTKPKAKPVPTNKEKQGPSDFSGIGCLLWIIVGIILGIIWIL